MGGAILGLDVGTNSIGWALIEDQDGRPSNLLDCGVRIFQEAVEAKTRTPKNKARREARLARRQTNRRKKRRQALIRLLTESGLMPEDPAERDALFKNLDPYRLRKRGQVRRSGC